MRNEVRTQRVNLQVALLAPLLMLLAWQVLVTTGAASAYAFSKPTSIIAVLTGEVVAGRLLLDTAASLARLLAGLSLGVSLGIALAFAVYLSGLFRSAVGPTLKFAASFPPMVWAPLVIATLGTGEASKVAFIAVATCFVQFSATYGGLVSIDGRLLEALAAFPRPIATQIRKIYWPGSLPHTLGGLKSSITFGWIALLFAEMMGSEDGLGWLLWNSRTFGRAPEMMVALLTIGVLGKLSMDVIDRLAKRLSPWYGQNGLAIPSGGRFGTTADTRRRRVRI